VFALVLLFVGWIGQRFHKRTIRRIRDLSKVRGMGLVLWRQVIGNTAIQPEVLEHWSHKIAVAFYSGFEMAQAIEIQRQIPPVPIGVFEQTRWINDNLALLDSLIDQDCPQTGNDQLLDS
jgi:hypothetical protein